MIESYEKTFGTQSNGWRAPGMLAMIAGLLLIALPIAIISQKFQAPVSSRSHQKPLMFFLCECVRFFSEFSVPGYL